MKIEEGKCSVYIYIYIYIYICICWREKGKRQKESTKLKVFRVYWKAGLLSHSYIHVESNIDLVFALPKWKLTDKNIRYPSIYLRYIRYR